MPGATDGAAIVRLALPARPDMVRVVRSVVAGVAAMLDAPYDAIEDLRLSADEACAHLLSELPEGTRLHLSFEPMRDAIRVTASVEAQADSWPSAGAHESLAWYVLTALTRDTAFSTDEGRPAISFVKQLVDG